MKILSLVCIAFLIAGACHAKPMACRDEAGREAAAAYVRDCMISSPATHPPCNETNPCWMMVKEVVRSCELGGIDAKLCARYKDLQKRYPPQTN